MKFSETSLRIHFALNQRLKVPYDISLELKHLFKYYSVFNKDILHGVSKPWLG
jgi:hypothetical protein